MPNELQKQSHQNFNHNSAEKYLEFHKDLVEASTREIEKVRGVYKWLTGLVSGLLALAMALGGFLYIKSMGDFQQNLQQENNFHQDKLNQQAEYYRAQLQTRLLQEIGDIKSKIEKDVERELSREQLIDLIQTKVKTQIESTAKPLIDEAVQAKVQPSISLAQDTLSKLQKKVEQADNQLSVMQKESEFWGAVNAARADDRHAFDQLYAWANDKKQPNQERAYSAWHQIYQEALRAAMWGSVKLPWTEGVDPMKYSLNDLSLMASSSPLFYRSLFVEYIWKRNDFSKVDRLAYLVNTMQNADSLKAVLYASKFFSEETKVPYGTDLFIKPALDWWQANKEKLEKEKAVLKN